MTPAWLLDAVAAVMLAVALVSGARLVAARPWRRGAVIIDTDLAHVLMAVAMAGTLAPSLRTLPDAWWEIAFGLLAAWFAVRVTRDARTSGARALAGGHCAPHLVHSAAMLYMFLAMTAPAARAAGMGGTGAMRVGPATAMTLASPTLALLFALILVGYSIWDLDQLSGRRYGPVIPRVSLAGPTAPVIPVPGFPALAGHPDAVDGGLAGLSAGAKAEAFLRSPAVTIGCRIAMGVAMAFMLLIAI